MDLKDKISKERYIRIKNQIKIDAAIGKHLRLAATENKGAVRYALRMRKKDEAIKSRIHLLAYGFLKGRSYIEIEAHTIYDKSVLLSQTKEYLQWQISDKYRNSSFENDLLNFFNIKEKREAA